MSPRALLAPGRKPGATSIWRCWRGRLEAAGFGRALGGFVAQDGVTLPSVESLESRLREEPSHPLSPARAELLQAMRMHELRRRAPHRPSSHKDTSVLAQCFNLNVPLTVHPGIGYDIISNHPMFNGAAIGRAAEMDFRIFGGSVEDLDGGVVLSVGSAIMGPQVFEKSLSCVNNLRLQAGRAIVQRAQASTWSICRTAAVGLDQR